jgi:3-methyladenine DNA glycosylase Tag
MSKNKDIAELTNILAIALRHKIGSIVNNNEIYAQKYAKDYESFMKEAMKISLRENWNPKDKIKIKDELKRKLIKELKNKDFIDIKKFSIMDTEIDKALKELKLL